MSTLGARLACASPPEVLPWLGRPRARCPRHSRREWSQPSPKLIGSNRTNHGNNDSGQRAFASGLAASRRLFYSLRPTRKAGELTDDMKGAPIQGDTLTARLHKREALRLRYGILERQKQGLDALASALESLAGIDAEWGERAFALRQKIAREVVANCEQIWELSTPGMGGLDAPAE